MKLIALAKPKYTDSRVGYSRIKKGAAPARTRGRESQETCGPRLGPHEALLRLKEPLRTQAHSYQRQGLRPDAGCQVAALSLLAVHTTAHLKRRRYAITAWVSASDSTRTSRWMTASRPTPCAPADETFR